MATCEELLQAVIDAPDDDVPRLAYVAIWKSGVMPIVPNSFAHSAL